MASLLEQLQAEAMDLSVPVVSLLMKMKTLATKLDLRDLLDWVDRELKGYAIIDDIPAYRMVHGEFKGWNPYQGWLPIIFPKSVKIPATRGVTSPIGELEGYHPKDGDITAIILQPQEKALIANALEAPTEVAWIVNSSHVMGIVGAVRNLVLEWSLQLEKLGITGEGLSFSAEEKSKAHKEAGSINIAHIEHFAAGAIGYQSLSHSPIQVTQTVKTSPDLNATRQLVTQIEHHLTELPAESLPAVRNGIKQVNGELTSPKPNPSKIRAALAAITTALEGAAGNLIASGILVEIAKILH